MSNADKQRKYSCSCPHPFIFMASHPKETSPRTAVDAVQQTQRSSAQLRLLSFCLCYHGNPCACCRVAPSPCTEGMPWPGFPAAGTSVPALMAQGWARWVFPGGFPTQMMLCVCQAGSSLKYKPAIWMVKGENFSGVKGSPPPSLGFFISIHLAWGSGI